MSGKLAKLETDCKTSWDHLRAVVKHDMAPSLKSKSLSRCVFAPSVEINVMMNKQTVYCLSCASNILVFVCLFVCLFVCMFNSKMITFRFVYLHSIIVADFQISWLTVPSG